MEAVFGLNLSKVFNHCFFNGFCKQVISKTGKEYTSISF
jgi:hypothetical protein